MKNQIAITVIATLTCFALRAQEKTAELSLADGLKLLDFRVHEGGYFSLLRQGKKEEASKYTLVDDNLEIVTYTSAEKIKAPQLGEERSFNLWSDFNNPFNHTYFSNTGKNVLYKNSRKYFVWNGSETEFAQNDLNSDIEENTKIDVINYGNPRDFISKEFLTDSYLLSIGRKEGGGSFNKGNYADMDIYLYRKNLKTLKEAYLDLQLPKDCCYFTVLDPSLLYYDNETFILSYALKNGETTNRFTWKKYKPRPEELSKTYRVITYNYNAEVVADATIEINRPAVTDAFGITNLSTASFYYWFDGIGNRSRVETIPTTESMAQLTYSKGEDAFYVHSVLKLEDKDDAFMLQKFDSSGNLVWNTYRELPGFSLHNFNMKHMRLLVDVAENFVGVSLYSYSSQDHNKFYVLDKGTGDIINEKEFGRHDNKRVARFLKTKTGNYSAMVLKDEFSENLTLDKNTFLASLYDADYKEFVKELSTCDQNYALLSYFTPTGIVTIAKPENNEKLQFYKFSLKASEN